MVIFHAFFMVLAGLVWELGFGVKSGHFGTLDLLKIIFGKIYPLEVLFRFWCFQVLAHLFHDNNKKKKKPSALS